MDYIKEQRLLLDIVETWNLSETPEYRGFRCASCQRYKNEAWYHWLDFGNYKLPVHMCNDSCQDSFNSDEIQIDSAKKTVINRDLFGNLYKFKEETKKRFEEIVSSWQMKEQVKLKPFYCDECKGDLDIDLTDGQRKGFHVWWKMLDGKTLAELHFHKTCANKLGIS